ncbi:MULTISPECIES: inositol monophosphatase family protein [Vibrio]|uniref:inositol monophosphatase family protein n=1 Tax=Vibrio TaxID=662 RepID=UPI0002E6E0B0|nr:MULTISPECIES: inositol monophosphatase family protein [Vibrio]OEE96930.1 inositol monophosphatase [Vibrio crassostreae 9ZC77]PMK13555.1 inositol monophosphatase [Vibrio sp. 10N.261.54.E10]
MKLLINIIKDNLGTILSLRQLKEMKDDGSFVSKGDLLVESLVNDFVTEHYPGHTLISEEMHCSGAYEEFEWNENGSYVVLDPIDGTENFVSGLKEWGVGISVFTDGEHVESLIYLPELDDYALSGEKQIQYESRIVGLSSSLTKSDLVNLEEGFEYRIIGCSMYNTLNAVRGAYKRFENVKGVNCWDILPGLNLALENNKKVLVDGKPYQGQLLFPTQKYKIVIESD